MTQLAGEMWSQATLVILYSVVALTAATHALLNKRDPRSAWAWITVCWLFPLAGALLYYLFGINRIHERARRMVGPDVSAHGPLTHDALSALEGVSAIEMQELIRIGSAMTRRPLTAGNTIEPLFDGDTAYPAMLQAIRKADRTVHLASYIFHADQTGEEFALALAEAKGRGVKVRVLLDGVADVFYRPRASHMLKRHGVQPALFLPPRWWPPMMHINLRNHRKLLVVDGESAFTGGMNISDGHRQQRCGAAPSASAGGAEVFSWTPAAISDVHFRLNGPVVTQLEQVFLEDWRLASGERVQVSPAAELSSPALTPGAAGNAVARVITDGPNEELDRLLMILLGALASAHKRVWIMTPYLVPPPALLSALQSAALRGVEVCLLLPQRSDQAWMDGATRHLLWQLLQNQVQVHWRPAPFAHTKLLIVDSYYVHFGSANMDTRSLRLNFEAVVEIYGHELAATLARHFETERARSQPVTLAELKRRSLAARLRDAFFWLFTPYL